MLSREAKPGQLWEVSGWGKVATYLLLEKRVVKGVKVWFALCIEDERACNLLYEFNDAVKYSTRIV